MNRFPYKIENLIKKDVNLKKHCWFNVGGVGRYYFKPNSIDDICEFIEANKELNLPFCIAGAGSNLIFKDDGFEGVLIKLGNNFNYINMEDNNPEIITAGANTLDYNVAIFCKEHSVTNLEFLSGIPGVIGGALAMNAGAYGSEIKDVLFEATAINTLTGEVKNFSCEEMGFSYRHNSLPKEWFFVEAKLKVKAGDKAEIAGKIDEIQGARNLTQPIKSKTGGSTFKNPPGDKKAWQLIDECGLRGKEIGGAQISPLHCNFIINHGAAKSQDILDLIELCKEQVSALFGIVLEEEIKIFS